MAYLSLYRKYRPQSFADVVGQDHVVQTLQNALKQGKIAHGYLFCGTRGVAKTTIARIFAKCLNCIGPDGTRSTPSADPCNECEPCKTITAGQCVDVVEMDAASNRSVTDIARLRENVRFGPMKSRYKTYIVDEAHQLSSDAKDAFLKTLEEPPAGVVFILATTELHAIPFTIASRCQRFDFHRGTHALIAQQIDQILTAEQATLTSDAVAAVARAAEGSYRDALSLLDQVIAYKRQDVSAADVAEILGVVEAQTIDALIDVIATKDAVRAFDIADSLFITGKDIRHLLKSLALRFRDLLYAGAGAGDLTQMAGDQVALQTLKQQAVSFTPAQLIAMADLVTEADRDAKHQNQHKLILEMVLLKLMYTGDPGLASRAQLSAPAAAAYIANGPSKPTVPVQARAVTQQAEPTRTAQERTGHAVPPKLAVPGPTVGRSSMGTPAGAAEGDALELIKGRWDEVVNRVSVRSPAGRPVILDACPEEQRGNTIVLSFSSKWNVDKLDKPKARAVIEEVINHTLRAEDNTYHISAVLRAPAPQSAPAEATRQESFVQQTLDSSPLLDEVIAVFGGKLIEPEER